MTVARKDGLYSLNLHTDAMGSAVNLGGVLNTNIKTGTEVRSESTSGHYYPRFQAKYAEEPMVSASTKQLAVALAQLGSLGIPITSATNTGLTVYAWQREHGSTRKAGSNHRKYVISDGILVPRSISVSHRDDATLGVEALATWDGTNDPVIESDSNALPTAAGDDERFTLGSLAVGGVSLACLKSAEIDFGLNVTRESCDSDIFPSHVSIDDQMIMLTFRGINVEWLKSTNIPRSGKVATHANSTFYLRKRDRSTSSGFVANGTAEHIKFTFDGLAFVEDAFNADGTAAAECSLKVACVFDGTNAPITIDTASAISL